MNPSPSLVAFNTQTLGVERSKRAAKHARVESPRAVQRMKHVYKAFTRLCETSASTVDVPSSSRYGDARVTFGDSKPNGLVYL